MKPFLMFLCAAALAGCASSPVAVNQAEQVPAARVFAPAQMLTPCAQCGALIVTRDDGTVYAAAASDDIAVDGLRVATMEPGEKVRVYLAPGRHFLNIPSLSAAPSAAFIIKPGETLVYRISRLGSGSVILQPAA